MTTNGLALCGHKVRGSDTPCQLRKHHRGPHSVVAFWCDSCSQRRRGWPHVTDGHGLAHCFLCCVEAGRAPRNLV